MTDTEFHPAWKVELLTPAPDNPRRDLGDLADLAESIAGVGVLEPIVATTTATTEDDGRLLVVAGHRRLAAAQKAGLATVPVLAHELMPDPVRVEAMVVENVQRCALTPTEEAAAYDQLAKLGVKQRDLAARIGVSQPHISRRLSLLKLPEPARDAVDTGSIKLEDAVRLAQVPTAQVSALFAGGQPDRWQIDRAIREHEQELALARQKAELEKAGVRILPAPDGGWDEAKGPVPVAWLDWVDASDHESEECHAVVLQTRGFLAVCTSPGRHPEPEQEESPEGPKPARLNMGDEFAALAAEAEARKQVCRRLVTERDINAHFAGGFLARSLTVWPPADGLDFAVACSILGVELNSEDRFDDRAARDILTGFLDGDGAARAAYALALANLETAVPSWHGHLDPGDDRDAEQLAACRLYLAHLTGPGDHTPTAAELELMGEPAEPATAEFSTTVTAKGRKFAVSCSCGETLHPNTTREYADDAAAVHLRDVHGVAPAGQAQ